MFKIPESDFDEIPKVPESALEQAEHERITVGTIDLSRQIRRTVDELYSNLLDQFGDQSLFEDFKKSLGPIDADPANFDREIFEKVVFEKVGKGGKAPEITLYSFLLEFERQVEQGEIFGHIFLRKFEQTLAHKFQNPLGRVIKILRRVSKSDRSEITIFFNKFRDDINALFAEIKKLSDEREIVEPTDPTRLPSGDIVKLCQDMLCGLGLCKDKKSGICFSPDEIRNYFKGLKLTDGEVSNLKSALFYLSGAIKKVRQGEGSFEIEKVIRGLAKLVNDSRDKASKRTPYKLLALNILLHFQILQQDDSHPDFVLKSFAELEAILHDPKFLTEEHTKLDPSVADHVLRETAAQEGGQRTANGFFS